MNKEERLLKEIFRKIVGLEAAFFAFAHVTMDEEKREEFKIMLKEMIKSSGELNKDLFNL